jgi:aminoglycoside phosphotransferase (APT) family kinase protein
MAVWDAELVVDEALVHAVLGEQFPELDAGSARLLGEGWDNAVWLVEETWAFRFPRREIAISGVERELAVLPRLAPLVPLRVPVPMFVGQPSRRYPWPFFGSALLPGVEVPEAELGADSRIELGAELGRFLRVLHRVELDVDLPLDPLDRADARKQSARAEQLLAECAWLRLERAESLFEQASELGPATDGALVHGDLHPRHVLVERGAVSGVIDWGDVCLGDPSIDLQIAWSLLPPAARSSFFDEYGAVDEERRLRARVLAVRLCGLLAQYARSVGYSGLEREALAGLERALVD